MRATHSNDFEKAFEEFLEGREYDEAANILFTIARAAFAAGWKAAGGAPPQPHRAWQVLRREDSLTTKE